MQEVENAGLHVQSECLVFVLFGRVIVVTESASEDCFLCL